MSEHDEAKPERPAPDCRQSQRLEPKLAGVGPGAKRGQHSGASLTASRSLCKWPHPSTHKNPGPPGLICLTQNCRTHSTTSPSSGHRDTLTCTQEYTQRHSTRHTGRTAWNQMHVDNRHTRTQIEQCTHWDIAQHKKQMDKHRQEKSLPVCPAGCPRLIPSSTGTLFNPSLGGFVLCITSLGPSSSCPRSSLGLSLAHDPFCCSGTVGLLSSLDTWSLNIGTVCYVSDSGTSYGVWHVAQS